MFNLKIYIRWVWGYYTSVLILGISDLKNKLNIAYSDQNIYFFIE